MAVPPLCVLCSTLKGKKMKRPLQGAWRLLEGAHRGEREAVQGVRESAREALGGSQAAQHGQQYMLL